MQQRAHAVEDEDVLSFIDDALPEVYGYLFSRTRQTTIAEDETIVSAEQFDIAIVNAIRRANEALAQP